MVIAWGGVSGAAGYNVYRNGSKVNAAPVAGTSYTDSGLAAATTYSWTRAPPSTPTVPRAPRPRRPPAPPPARAAGDLLHRVELRAHHAPAAPRRAAATRYANGSNQNMGLWNVFVTTTLKQTAPNYYVIGTCP